jgi:hypothetical protein
VTDVALVTGGIRNRFSDGVRQVMIGAAGNGSELSFLAPEARDLDVRLDVGGWVDGRGGGITDGVGEGCLFGRFELLTVKGECGVKGTGTY